MCCTGKELNYRTMVPPWAEDLGKQTAGEIGEGMRGGATPMPEDLFGAYMGAAQMPSFGFGPMQFLNEMYGGGNQFQPQQFNPMDFYQSIYPQQQQQQPYRQPAVPPQGSYAQPFG